MTKRNTKPDAPKALAKTKKAALAPVDAVEGADASVSHALQLLADALSDNPSIETVTLVEMAVKNWTKRLEDTEKVSKSLLIDHLKQHGKQTTDKGSLSLNVNGYIVEARPWRTGLDSKKVESLLRAKELSVDEFMDKEVRYLVNESRLELGIVQGIFTKEELDTCKWELSYALQPIKKAKD